MERHLTGKETEPWEMLYFKVYKSQLAVIEQALETASLMLGGRKGARLLPGDDLRGFSGWREPRSCRQFRRLALSAESNLPAASEPTAGGISIKDSESIMTSSNPRQPRLRLDAVSYRALSQKVLERDGWRCQRCGRSQDLQVHHMQLRSQLGGDVEENLITLCSTCHRQAHFQPGLCAWSGPGIE